MASPLALWDKRYSFDGELEISGSRTACEVQLQSLYRASQKMPLKLPHCTVLYHYSAAARAGFRVHVAVPMFVQPRTRQ